MENNSEQVEVPELQEVIAYQTRDESLLGIVKIANLGAGIGITLLVEGQVVFGDLVSGKEYFEKISEKIKGADGSAEIADSISSMFLNFGESYYDQPINDIPQNYLHIKNYAFLKGDGYPVNFQDAYMRIAIEKISGFAIGRTS